MGTLHRLALASIALQLAVPGAPAKADDIGLGVLVQAWNPQTDDDQARSMVYDSTLLSRSFHEGWDTISPTLHEKLKGLLATGNLIADGVTLYDVDLWIDPPALSLERLSGGGDDPLLLELGVLFPHVHLEATSTTPDVALGVGFGDYLDPRCSIDFDLRVRFPLGLGTDPARPLFTDITLDDAAQRPIASISNFVVDSQNFPCDVLVAALSVAGVDQQISDAVTDPHRPEAAQINRLLIQQLLDAIQTANAAIDAVVPAGLIRLNAWASTGPSSMLTLAFGVRGPFADAGPSATLRGTLRQHDAPGTLASTLTPATNFNLTASRKTGPRPILNPAGELGEHPLEVLENAQFRVEMAGDEMHYTLTGLSATFPNYVELGSRSPCDGPDPSSVQYITKVRDVDNHPLPVILPSDLTQSFDLLATQYSELCGAFTPAVLTPQQRNVDPRINPVNDRGIIIVGGAGNPGGAASATSTASVSNSAVIRSLSVNRTLMR